MAHTPAMIADPMAIGRGGQGAPPSPPPGTRVYAVGDIHGRADLLREINLLIHEDAYRRQAPRNVIVYLGDYIDRGDAPRGVIELLLNDPLPGFQCVHLRGNHEDILCRFLKDVSVGPNWFAFGGLETLEAYGVAPPEPVTGVAELQRAQRDLIAQLPADHRNFLRRLPVSHTEGDYFFVHAGIRPGVALKRQSRDDLLWIRDEFLESDETFPKIIVHGHTITAAPDVRRNRIGIDTGAYASGHLTCFVAEGRDWGFLQT